MNASDFWNYGTNPQKYALEGVSPFGIALIAEAEGLLDCVPVADMVDVIRKIEWPDGARAVVKPR